MIARHIPLTFRWHLLVWRGGPRLAVRPLRGRDSGQAQMIGATFSIARFTLAALSVRIYDHGISKHWCHDFGRFSIGGWRNGRRVPVSTGWMLANRDPRIISGISVTLASRTVYLIRLCTRAEHRADLARRRQGTREP
ncbi:hypothetical protein ACFUJY_29570 [Streptomyces sp. NPDC057249]|uniref:hypothetical protein n=1 Tax=Streptomyces sp. NPDC057249 TaxID=3346067 RepID=UPI00362D263E